MSHIIRGFVNGTKHQLAHHKDLYPLFSSFVIVSTAATGIILHTSINKGDVSFNKFLNPDPMNVVSDKRNWQKFLFFNPKVNEDRNYLRSLIYKDGEYPRSSGGKIVCVN